MPAIDSTSVVHRDKRYHFAHFEGDYIPSKIRESGKFYEAPFLNLLARLAEMSTFPSQKGEIENVTNRLFGRGKPTDVVKAAMGVPL